MTSAEVLELVRRMRAAQRSYFRTRDGGVLHEACRLEKAVDAELATIFAGQPPAPAPVPGWTETKPAGPTQPDMFEGD